VWFYLWKAIAPINLSIIYPRWEIDPGAVRNWIPGILLIAVGFGFWKGGSGTEVFRAEFRALSFACGYFLITLLPVLGLFNMSYFAFSRVADHLQYLAVIGIVVLLAAWLHRLGQKLFPKVPFGSAFVFGIVLIFFSFAGWERARVFSSPERLWRDALEKNPRSYPVHYNLAGVLDDAGRLDEAIAHFQQAIQINPKGANAFNNLGYVFHRLGKLEAAETNYLSALRVNPKFADAHANMGAILLQRGELDDAIRHLTQALQARRIFPAAHYNLGRTLMMQGRFDEAWPHLQAARDTGADWEDARKIIEAFQLLREQWNGRTPQ
jgi:tetratricopeptide (TPR) repeat protein